MASTMGGGDEVAAVDRAASDGGASVGREDTGACSVRPPLSPPAPGHASPQGMPLEGSPPRSPALSRVSSAGGSEHAPTRIRKASLLFPVQAEDKSGDPFVRQRTLARCKSSFSLSTQPPLAENGDTRTTPSRRRRLLSYVASPQEPETSKLAPPEPTTPSRERFSAYERARASSSPGAWSPKEASGGSVPTQAQVDALVRACAEEKVLGQSASLSHDVLHAVAAKERRCLELREELGLEEAHLRELRDAWHRLVNRTGQEVPRSKYKARANADRRGTEVADDTTTPKPARTDGGSPAPRAARRTVDAPAPPEKDPPLLHRTASDDAPAAPATARVAADVLGLVPARAPPAQNDSASKRASTLVDSWHTLQRQFETHLPVSGGGGRENAPAYEHKDETGGTDNALQITSEKLASGWNVLSQRLRATTSTITDSAPWTAAVAEARSVLSATPSSHASSLPSDDAPPSDLSDGPSFPQRSFVQPAPLSLSPGIGMVGMLPLPWDDAARTARDASERTAPCATHGV
ncbi:hypothetical protein MSPP1_001799 [Malassezia sp. CBS 17886]|nr:hypothetical protein MSPP1_001799 [Malassezia sp. CBS 17886]